MNNKAQFTPGPWEHKGNRVYRKDSYEVAWIAGQGPHSEWQANATLIAAAPAMYEALKGCLRVTEAWKSQAEMDGDTVEIEAAVMEIRRIKVALAQAEGRHHE